MRMMYKFCGGKTGMKSHGRCDKEGQRLITNAWEEHREKIDGATSSTHWINLYMQKKFQV